VQPTIGDEPSATGYYSGLGNSFGLGINTDLSQFTLTRWLQAWQRGRDDIVVVFYDSHVLGLAREMHCFKNHDRLAFVPIDSCVAYNFGQLPGEPGYPDPQASLALAISHLETGSPAPRSVSAIDMYDPDSLTGTGTDFFEFDGTGNLTKTLLFDSEGPKFVPDACSTCHGGKRRGAVFSDGYFLPFMPSLYTFSSRAGYTLNDQLDKFATLNSGVPSFWGGRVDRFLFSASRTELAQGPTAPSGWRQQPGFFSNVLVPYCFGCHAVLPPGTLQFGTPADFVANAAKIRAAVCGQHTMPASSAAYRRFWSTGLQQLALNDVLPPPGSGEPTCR
jgi:hypothetical protein